MPRPDLLEHLENESERHRNNIHELRGLIQGLQLEVVVLKTKMAMVAGLAGGCGAFAGTVVIAVVQFIIQHWK